MRKKWTAVEDQALRTIMSGMNGGAVDWKDISEQMTGQGFPKSARQTRERWVNQLDPTLDHDSLDSADYDRLLTLHSTLGNSWKQIAQSFPGHSDNGIKNQFFAMIRKSLRKARKVGRQSAHASHVNDIKPRMLSKFLSLPLRIPPDVYTASDDFPWSRENPVKVFDFLRFFFLNKSAAYEDRIDEKMARMINHILAKLEEQNKEYVSSKKFPGKHRKILKKSRSSTKTTSRKEAKARKKEASPPKAAAPAAPAPSEPDLRLQRRNTNQSLKRNADDAANLSKPSLKRTDSFNPLFEEDGLYRQTSIDRINNGPSDTYLQDDTNVLHLNRRSSRYNPCEEDKVDVNQLEFQRRPELRHNTSVMSNLSSYRTNNPKY